ncbi:MAG TPA: cytochrome c3 family protein [Methylomirabilota bacterium]|nr:cytochrome c3 family protein [Methylomirabilota bacterium]
MIGRLAAAAGLGVGVALAAAVFASTSAGGGARVPATAQLSKPGPVPPSAPAAPHGEGELDCRNCHRGNHRGVVQMYLGLGGRGTPMIPSHMVQVRVECAACHTTHKTVDGARAIVGETFRPSEQACVNCHGEKYRGMIGRWSSTLTRMQDAMAPKLAAARAALPGAEPGNPRQARARKLVEDAEFNVRFVTLAKGVHNVFYAADLLKLADGWLDEAAGLLGRAPVKTDDALVRGGYCAVLCHEAAGVKPRPLVTFARQKLPHTRHVTELGATCTSCHSAETHKAVTATPATCRACHHGPANERCEACHRAQSAFYRGRTPASPAPVAPNLMAEAVSCTGCHDFSRKHSREAVGRKCLDCHEPPYAALAAEWTTGFDVDLRKTAAAVRDAEAALARSRRAGRADPKAEALAREAREALALVRSARPAHNPLGAEALLAAARAKAQEARALASP